MSKQSSSPKYSVDDPQLPKLKYLSWRIENTLEKRFPGIQSALDIAFAVIENNHLEHSDLGKKILEMLDKTQEQFCQAGESATMINNHLGGTSQESVLAEKHIQIMENALAVLDKGVEYAIEGIKNVLTLVENYTPEKDVDSSKEAINAALSEEAEVSASWFRVPHWLKQIFAYKEEEPGQPAISPTVDTLTSEKLSKIKEELANAYEKARSAAEGKYTSLHRTDIVNVLYESVVKTSSKPYSPTSD